MKKQSMSLVCNALVHLWLHFILSIIEMVPWGGLIAQIDKKARKRRSLVPLGLDFESVLTSGSFHSQYDMRS